MKIGQKFTFISSNKNRKALFLEQNKDLIKCVICDDEMAGINVKINQNQIIDETI